MALFTTSDSTVWREPSRVVRSRSATDAWLWVAFWMVAGIVVLPWDLAIARWNARDLIPGDLAALFARAEVVGHGYGVAGIAITIYLLDPSRRRHLFQLVISFVAAGMAANLLKVQIWRWRPRHLLESDQTSSFVGSIWTSADWSWQTFREHTQQSFPSAHTAGAVAMAYVLSRLYPAGRGWFYLLVFFCALNRITGNAHFTSDVCWGAALGYGIARLIDRKRWIGTGGTRMGAERSGSRREGRPLRYRGFIDEEVRLHSAGRAPLAETSASLNDEGHG